VSKIKSEKSILFFQSTLKVNKTKKAKQTSLFIINTKSTEKTPAIKTEKKGTIKICSFYKLTQKGKKKHNFHSIKSALKSKKQGK